MVNLCEIRFLSFLGDKKYYACIIVQNKKLRIIVDI